MPVRPQKKKSRVKTEVTAKALAEMAMQLVADEKDPEIAADLQEMAHAEMDRELFSLKRELRRLQDLYNRASPASKKRSEELLDLAEEAVDRQQQKIADFLAERPWLAAKMKKERSVEQRSESHLDDAAWRSTLRHDQEQWEQEALEKLRKEQLQAEREWRQRERMQIESQETLIIEAIADRQAKLEEEFQLHQKDSTRVKTLEWLREQQQAIRHDLQQELAHIKSEAQKREEAWRKQCRQELQEKENLWREQRKRELQRMEVEWREQEIMHRQRKYLHDLEQEWLSEQRQALASVSSEWREELRRTQGEEWNRWVADRGKDWQALSAKFQDEMRAKQIEANVQAKRELEREQQRVLAQVATSWLEEQRAALQREQKSLQEAWSQRTEELAKSAQGELHSRLDATVQSWCQVQTDKFNSVLNKAMGVQREEATRELKRIAEEWAKQQQESVNRREAAWQKESAVFREALRTELISSNHEALSQVTAKWLGEQRAHLPLLREELSQAAQGSLQDKLEVVAKSWQQEQSKRFKALEDETLRRYTRELEQRSADVGQTLQKSIHVQREDAEQHLNKLSEEWLKEHQASLLERDKQWLREQQGQLEKVLRQNKDSLSQEVLTLRELERKDRARYWEESEKKWSVMGQEMEQRLLKWSEEQMKEGLKSFRSDISSLRQELLDQHQMELEIIGQELRADMKDELRKASTELTKSHGDAVLSASEEYELLLRSELAEITGQMSQRYEQDLGVAYAKWEEKSQRLEEAYEKYVEVHLNSLEQLRAEAKEGLEMRLAEALTELASDAEIKIREQLTHMTEQFSSEYQTQLRMVTENLEKEQFEGIEAAQANLQMIVISLTEEAKLQLQEHLDERYQSQSEEYSKKHQDELVKQRDNLEGQFSVELKKQLDNLHEQIAAKTGEARDQMVMDHKQQLEGFRKELYVQYRSRLGKIIEEVRQSVQPAQPTQTDTHVSKQEGKKSRKKPR